MKKRVFVVIMGQLFKVSKARQNVDKWYDIDRAICSKELIGAQ